MRWWAVGWMVAGVVAIAACSSSSDGDAPAGPSGSRSVKPPTGASAGTPAGPSTSETASPTAGNPSAPTSTPSSAVPGCAAGHVKVAVSPGDRGGRQLCVRPGTGISLVLQPRADDKRWRGVQSSAPVFVLVSGWRVDADGTAHATLRCAGTRAGKAKITALAKAPDVAGAADGAFTLDISVVPYPRQG